jgi:uncharacterized protein (DUF1778 family)
MASTEAQKKAMRKYHSKFNFFNIRVDDAEKAKIERAADISGESVTQFMKVQTLKKAEQILQIWVKVVEMQRQHAGIREIYEFLRTEQTLTATEKINILRKLGLEKGQEQK